MFNLSIAISGHKRTGSNAEIIKEDVCDVDIEVYITELTALLRLMQVCRVTFDRIIYTCGKICFHLSSCVIKLKISLTDLISI